MKSWTATAVPVLDGVAPPLTVHDTSSGRRVTLEPEGTAGLYVCGITPYDATHIGHAATYVTFDLVVRQWRDAGHEVTYVQNVTDVDEPLLERAQRDGVDWQVLAAQETELFRHDMESLNVLPPQHFVGAVEGIPDDVAAVEQLLADGAAYVLPPNGEDGADVYLDVVHQRGFGRVSGWDREEMLEVFAERGGDPERPGKRDPLDPLLWRAERSGEPAWPGGSLGPGRPGWHIECTTIALRHLGMGFEVKGGGTDLIFPHHEMSSVQAEALTGEEPFAQAYVHQAMVGYQGQKMSKSVGNLVLVSRLRRAGVDPMVVRLVLLTQHYRTPWEWTEELMAPAEDRLRRWRAAADRAVPATLLSHLRERLADDLDAPGAVAAVDGWLAAGAGQDADPAAGGRPARLAEVTDALLGVRLDGGT